MLCKIEFFTKFEFFVFFKQEQFEGWWDEKNLLNRANDFWDLDLRSSIWRSVEKAKNYDFFLFFLFFFFWKLFFCIISWETFCRLFNLENWALQHFTTKFLKRQKFGSFFQCRKGSELTFPLVEAGRDKRKQFFS